MKDGRGELISTAEEYLKIGDYKGCRNAVLNSPHFHPTNLTATQILTLTDILSSFNPIRPDHYSVLFITRFSDNPALIKSRFRTLASLLNPNTNPLSLSSYAFSLLVRAHSVLSDLESKADYDKWLKLVLKEPDLRFRTLASLLNLNTNPLSLASYVFSLLVRAYAVLSDTVKKAEYHKWLKLVIEEPDLSGTGGMGFWTMCPYCYYVYEYDRAYKECCLRCKNEECGRAFTAVEIRVPPPETVAESGRYLCLGFLPIGFKGLASWSPFLTPFEDEEEEKEEEIRSEVDGIRAEKSGFKRRKSVGVCAKKVMGKGVRVQAGRIFGCS